MLLIKFPAWCVHLPKGKCQASFHRTLINEISAFNKSCSWESGQTSCFKILQNETWVRYFVSEVIIESHFFPFCRTNYLVGWISGIFCAQRMQKDDFRMCHSTYKMGDISDVSESKTEMDSVNMTCSVWHLTQLTVSGVNLVGQGHFVKHHLTELTHHWQVFVGGSMR